MTHRYIEIAIAKQHSFPTVGCAVNRHQWGIVKSEVLPFKQTSYCLYDHCAINECKCNLEHC